jgi:hypothetical protein
MFTKEALHPTCVATFKLQAPPPTKESPATRKISFACSRAKKPGEEDGNGENDRKEEAPSIIKSRRLLEIGLGRAEEKPREEGKEISWSCLCWIWDTTVIKYQSSYVNVIFPYLGTCQAVFSSSHRCKIWCASLSYSGSILK